MDYILTSISLQYNVHKTDIKPGIRSDHSIVQVKIYLRDTLLRGKGFWKFNVSLLKDLDYVNKIKQILKHHTNNPPPNIDKGLLWDSIKCEIRGTTISHSSYKTKIKKEFEKSLQSRLNILDELICTTPSTDTLDEYHSVKSQLESIALERAKGAMIS